MIRGARRARLPARSLAPSRRWVYSDRVPKRPIQQAPNEPDFVYKRRLWRNHLSGLRSAFYQENVEKERAREEEARARVAKQAEERRMRQQLRAERKAKNMARHADRVAKDRAAKEERFALLEKLGALRSELRAGYRREQLERIAEEADSWVGTDVAALDEVCAPSSLFASETNPFFPVDFDPSFRTHWARVTHDMDENVDAFLGTASPAAEWMPVILDEHQRLIRRRANAVDREAERMRQELVREIEADREAAEGGGKFSAALDEEGEGDDDFLGGDEEEEGGGPAPEWLRRWRGEEAVVVREPRRLRALRDSLLAAASRAQGAGPFATGALAALQQDGMGDALPIDADAAVKPLLALDNLERATVTGGDAAAAGTGAPRGSRLDGSSKSASKALDAWQEAAAEARSTAEEARRQQDALARARTAAQQQGEDGEEAARLVAAAREAAAKAREAAAVAVRAGGDAALEEPAEREWREGVAPRLQALREAASGGVDPEAVAQSLRRTRIALLREHKALFSELAAVSPAVADALRGRREQLVKQRGEGEGEGAGLLTPEQELEALAVSLEDLPPHVARRAQEQVAGEVAGSGPSAAHAYGRFAHEQAEAVLDATTRNPGARRHVPEELATAVRAARAAGETLGGRTARREAAAAASRALGGAAAAVVQGDSSSSASSSASSAADAVASADALRAHAAAVADSSLAGSSLTAARRLVEAERAAAWADRARALGGQELAQRAAARAMRHGRALRDALASHVASGEGGELTELQALVAQRNSAVGDSVAAGGDGSGGDRVPDVAERGAAEVDLALAPGSVPTGRTPVHVPAVATPAEMARFVALWRAREARTRFLFDQLTAAEAEAATRSDDLRQQLHSAGSFSMRSLLLEADEKAPEDMVAVASEVDRMVARMRGE